MLYQKLQPQLLSPGSHPTHQTIRGSVGWTRDGHGWGQSCLRLHPLLSWGHQHHPQPGYDLCDCLKYLCNITCYRAIENAEHYFLTCPCQKSYIHTCKSFDYQQKLFCMVHIQMSCMHVWFKEYIRVQTLNTIQIKILCWKTIKIFFEQIVPAVMSGLRI